VQVFTPPLLPPDPPVELAGADSYQHLDQLGLGADSMASQSCSQTPSSFFTSSNAAGYSNDPNGGATFQISVERCRFKGNP